MLETKVKLKHLQIPWMTKTLRKPSKQKQKLYIKFLKSKNAEDELVYKNYKFLFPDFEKKTGKFQKKNQSLPTTLVT